MNLNEVSFGSSPEKTALTAAGYSTMRATGGGERGVHELFKTKAPSYHGILSLSWSSILSARLTEPELRKDLTTRAVGSPRQLCSWGYIR